MNRSIEKILSTIAVCVDAGFVIFLGIFALIINVNLREGTSAVPHGDLLIIFSIFLHLLWLPAVMYLISFILGLIGVLKLKVNSKLSGILFISASCITGMFIFTGFGIHTLLYIVAAIMCFVRKPKDKIAV
ncbi:MULTISPECIES: DUF4064 domain-containing protein [unclassified Oceanobacillus]|uniref:DUF4064 domain-containing protein n=1 Tax=unclassified Oceanobacillus TaxID=2630292 RepID=UPI001BEA3B58|nr:DUF4064 domain-containing protein [Oceanobacillus sp. ISL-74]MBT2651885.1 DUF4064 domain-containing protein [Oceanobacillus sp. ISL-73]